MKLVSRQAKVSIYGTDRLHARLQELKALGGQEAVNAMYAAVGRALLWNMVSDSPFHAVKMNVDPKDMEVLCTYTDNDTARSFTLAAVYRGPLPERSDGAVRDGVKTWSFHS